MKDYLANEVRNVVALGHSGAGKSTVIEACMYYTKAIQKFGPNNDGTTALNFDAEEGKRGVSCYMHVVRHISNHHTTCANRRPVSDLLSRKNMRANMLYRFFSN